MGNDCGCGERREYMTLGEYMELYPTAYAEATAGMTEHQKQLFELRFCDRFLYLPKDETTPDAPVDPSGIDIEDVTIDGVTNVSYGPDVADALFEYNGAKVEYIDRDTGEKKTDDIKNVSLVLPIKPGKYISMGTDDSGAKLEVGIDDAALSSDYFKIDKTKQSTRLWVPYWRGTTSMIRATGDADGFTLVYRDNEGAAKFGKLSTELISTGSGAYSASTVNIVTNCITDIGIQDQTTDKGSLTEYTLSQLQTYKRMNIIYKNQVYYRMDPIKAPDGTLNFIHIDSVQAGGGTYKATAKCFSITVSTRAWQVVDLIFCNGGSTEYAFTHHIHFDTSDGKVYAFDITTHDTQAISFDDLIANFDGLVINGLQAPELGATTLNPAIFKVAGADSEIELVSADLSVLSSIKQDNINQYEDYVTESKPN